MNERLLSRASQTLRGAVLVIAGSAAAVVGCDSQDLDGGSRQSVFVRAALAPPAPQPNGSCVYGNEPGAPALFRGAVDLGLRDDYTLTVLVQSMDSRATTISGVHVAVREPDGKLIREFDQVVSGFVAAGAYGAVSFIAIDAPTADVLRTALPNRAVSRTITVEATLRGTDPATGTAASSPEFLFPVQACNGCLVDFSTGNDVTFPRQPNCVMPVKTGSQMPCALGQDEATPCQLCQGRAACDPTTP